MPDSGLPVKAPVGWLEVKERLVRVTSSGVVGVGVALLTVAAVTARTKTRSLENMTVGCDESAGSKNVEYPGG